MGSPRKEAVMLLKPPLLSCTLSCLHLWDSFSQGWVVSKLVFISVHDRWSNIANGTRQAPSPFRAQEASRIEGSDFLSV